MSNRLGDRQTMLLELLESSCDKHEGEKIVKFSNAIEATGMHQSAVSRALKSLEEKKLIKRIVLKEVAKTSVTLPVAMSQEDQTLSSYSNVGNVVKAFAKYSSSLKDVNLIVVEETIRKRTDHEKVLLAIKRLRGVNFVFEQVFHREKTPDHGLTYQTYHFQPNTSSTEIIGNFIGKAIPLRYLVLESGFKMHLLKRLVSELEEVGYVRLVYSREVSGNTDFQDIIGLY
ncbi:hypothetical protein ACZ81_19060 [Alteromonas macleodii]|mgnify:CR=1 FL=1|uniref:MarR family transcriptional regulator n=1 Tax=Alteromonas macleodii (strain English Channel 673) TaxID=1004788 RepID=A0AB33A3Y1_ALTME|nr:helix-turn-helix domain-containing protein [Alteromonas macleodii]AFT76422.1 hypothetical protein AMEC673_18730 [Alteromonas macleodii str. 'English Channel 673']AMN13506.1 hypothetical protein ACZ81_19060 [Alteromonas macleodii]MBL3810455.1 MarR family transcriptional regulator [Alteromonas macleodii]MBL3883992.1 MarR family transcriptional regulator [Alteromonas macleodii]|tara:strand:+ start:730 stop:1416 length:687 start_codon:yes stop_codon:yes gene_type:complete